MIDNTKNDPAIFCHHLAVSDKTGRATLNVNSSLPANSLLEANPESSEYCGNGLLDTTSQVEVSVSTIEAICEELAIDHIDILKIDVQGGEFSVLAGESIS